MHPAIAALGLDRLYVSRVVNGTGMSANVWTGPRFAGFQRESIPMSSRPPAVKISVQ